jgi:ABC-type bacteriocin/lantibiotic exporter with double-glycine peptidase domain
MRSLSASHDEQVDAGVHVGGGHHEARPFSRVLEILKPERRDIFIVVLFAVTVSILSLATPIAVETLVNTVAFGVLIWPVVVISLVLMACLGVAAALKAMQVFVVECLQQRLFVRVVADYSRHIPALRLENLDRSNGPELANRFFDVLTLQKSIASLLLDGVAVLVMMVVGMVVLAFYHPFLVFLLLFGLGFGGVRTCLDESIAKYQTAAWLQEMFRCLRTVKTSAGQNFAFTRSNSLAESYIVMRRKHFRVVWRQTLFALGLQVAASTILLGLGGWLVINRQLTLGQLVAAELIVSVIVGSVAKLGKHAETFYDLLASAEKLSRVTDLPVEREGGQILPDTGMGMAVRVLPSDHLGSFLTWHIAPNERVALIAPSGYGKTKVLEALAGLREMTDGRAELDGFDIRNLSLAGLRDQVYLVGRDEIIEGTVLENLVMGSEEVRPDAIRAALEAVDLMETVNRLPNSLQTRLAPSGLPLSETQALKLMLARAIIARPRLLLIDGLLDHLNLRDHPKLLRSLTNPSTPWTLLVATHNPETAKVFDRCIRLNKEEREPGLETSRTSGGAKA